MYCIKVRTKKGYYRESVNPKIRDFRCDNYDLAFSFCSGLNVADSLVFRDRYFVFDMDTDN